MLELAAVSLYNRDPPSPGVWKMRRIRTQVLVLVLAFAFWLLPGYPDATNITTAAELSEIQRRGYLIVAVKDNLPPLGFTDASGKLQGLEIDLAKALATELLGKPEAIKLQPVANRDRLPQVLDHKVDLAIARVTATQSRARLVSFSIPYYFDGTRLITKNSSVQKLTDLAREKIAVLNHSSTIATVRYYLPQAKLVGVDSYQQARSLLESKAAIAFAADSSVLTGWVQQYPQYRLLALRLSTEPLSVVMPKGLQYEPLRRRINNAIARYLQQGWLQQRIQYWGLPPSQLNISQ